MKALIASSVVIAAMLAAAPAAVAQQNAAFCLRGSDSGALNCSFQTMAQCEQSKKGASNTESCIANPNRGTTGSGGSGMTPGSGTGQGSSRQPADPSR
jgi:hypothetical protein